MPPQQCNSARRGSAPLAKLASAFLTLPTFLPLLALILILVLIEACGRSRDPQAVLDHATSVFHHGDVGAAEQEARRGYEQFHGLSAEWAWKFRLLEADALAWKGRNDEVLSLITSDNSPPPSLDLTIREKRLEGLAYTYSHLFSKAQTKLDQAEQVCKASSYSPFPCADVVFAQGELKMEQGDFVRAESDFARSRTLARERGSTYMEANALLSLGYSALQQEHFDEALDWSTAAYERAVAIHAAHIAQTALGNEGWLYYKLGEPDKALSLLLAARDSAHKIGLDTFEATWLTTAGYVYLDAGDFEKAEQSYKQALALAQPTNQRDVTDALVSLATVSERSGKLDQARDYADKTIALAAKDGNRLDVLYPMLIKARVAERQQDSEQAEKIFRQIDLDPKSQVFLKWEAEHSLAQLYEGKNLLDAADREYQAALSTFESARSSLKHEESALPFPANASGIYDDYIHYLINTGRSDQALHVAEYQRGRTLAEGLGLLEKGTSFKPASLDPQAIARRAGGTILFYWLGERQSYLWAMNDRKTTLFVLPRKAEIDPRVLRYRKALAEQQEFLETASADGRALYQILVAPVQAWLPKDAKVFIIPDGTLNTLNFETLLVPGPAPNSAVHYWIEDVVVTDASSLRLLAASRSQARQSGRLLLLGDAVSPSADYPELRKASAEMESIEKHFSSAEQTVFARDRATPAAYLASGPGEFSYIHFVAHGTASMLSPLDSAIVLSKASTEDDSFKLYARDIIHHPLGAELITISTCSGAGARFYSGEGLVGLSWAFLRAGAHNVIGALWEVSDISTPRLMDELYRQLQNGQTPSSALRAAKFSLLHSTNVFNKPFYWAPFQLYTGS
jgi:CHAT domain-containing protein